MFNCTFHNNFGRSGASIELNEGGLIWGFGNSFTMDVSYQDLPSQIANLFDIKAEREVLVDEAQRDLGKNFDLVPPSIIDLIRDSYHGDVPFETFISDDSLQTVNKVSNEDGQLRI